MGSAMGLAETRRGLASTGDIEADNERNGGPVGAALENVRRGANELNRAIGSGDCYWSMGRKPRSTLRMRMPMAVL